MSHPPARQPWHRSVHRLLYSLLSAIIPGTGQILAGYRRRGGVMIAISLVIIAGTLIAYLQGINALLSYLVQPRILIGIFILNVAVFAFRLGSVVDAYWSPEPADERKPAGWRGGLVTLALVGMLGFTAAPHAVLGYYTYLTYDTLNQVFSVESIADDLEDEQQSSSPDPTPEPSPTPDTQPEADTSEDTGTPSGETPRTAWMRAESAGMSGGGDLRAHALKTPGPYP